ncbi:MAG: ATP-binding response regulator [Anaerolineae bacterium]
MAAIVARALGFVPGQESEQERLSRRRTVLTVAGCCALLTYAWSFNAATFTGNRLTPALDQIAPSLVLTACLVVTVALVGQPRYAGVAVSVGLLAALYLWPDPMRYYAAPAVVCLAGLLATRRAGLLAAVAVSFLPGIPFPALVSAWLTALGVFLAMGYIGAMIGAALESEQAAVRLKDELLDRRGELRRLNDSLRNAYTLLERTNHELAEARDEAEEAHRLKTQFAAAVSHELRTPLNLILGFSEVMYKTPEIYTGATITADLRGDIRQIRQSTQHLLDLVDDVLDLSRVEQVRLAFVPEVCDVADVVSEAVSAAAGLFRGKPVALTVSIEPDLPPCLIDRTRIRQVLINLLANAARFTTAGSVTVTASLDRDHGEVGICVADTGRGISEEERTRVFDAFYQVAHPLRREQGGTGLGLAVCKTFVQMHGGRIWVDSLPGGGSRFSFAIPVRGHPPKPADDWRLRGAPDPYGESVVTLDPDGRLASLLERALPELKVHNTGEPGQLRELVARWHPRAVVTFARADAEAAQPGIACPGLPVIHCRVRERQPLSAYANVRAVLTKPITAAALMERLATLGDLKTLLLADDDEGMARLIRRTLSQSRPRTSLHTARNGVQALALLEQLTPDAMILDLAMPEMDGFGVLRAMSSGGAPHVPVLVLTAMDLDGGDGSIAASELAVSASPWFGGADVARYVHALAQAARPRYVS